MWYEVLSQMRGRMDGKEGSSEALWRINDKRHVTAVIRAAIACQEAGVAGH